MHEKNSTLLWIVNCEPAIERLHVASWCCSLLHCRISDLASRKRLPDKIQLVLPIKGKTSQLFCQNRMYIAKCCRRFNGNHPWFKKWKSSVMPVTISWIESIGGLQLKHWVVWNVFIRWVFPVCVFWNPFIYLIDSGQAVRIKRVVKQEGDEQVTPANESAQQVSIDYSVWFWGWIWYNTKSLFVFLKLSVCSCIL